MEWGQLELTISAVEDADCVEQIPANGAGVSLLSPGADASIVNNVFTAIEGCDNIQVVVVILDSRGCSWRWWWWYLLLHWDVWRRCNLLEVGAGRARKGERVQAYDALFWLRHDADCGGSDESLMKT